MPDHGYSRDLPHESKLQPPRETKTRPRPRADRRRRFDAPSAQDPLTHQALVLWGYRKHGELASPCRDLWQQVLAVTPMRGAFFLAGRNGVRLTCGDGPFP